MTEFTIRPVENTEWHLVLPTEFVGHGEPGDPFTPEFQELLRMMANMAQVWPVDFGEADDTHIVVWFDRGESVEHALFQAEFFINSGGDV